MIGCYIRVSTLKQKIDGVSIDMQKEMCVKHALLLDLIKDGDELKYYVDDGFSGKSLERPNMRKLINDIKVEKINMLLAYDMSRISRDIFDSNYFLNLIQKHSVILKCIYDDVSIKNANSRYTTNIKIATNQFERERIVERTNDGLISIAESGRYPIGGKVLFGYYRGKDKNIYIDDEKGNIVKNVFKMACERNTLDEMKNYINKAQSERYFHTYQITKLLYDKRYSGVLKYKNKIYKNIIPMLVSEDTQEKAIKLHKKREYGQNDYLFCDLLFCENCGNKLVNTMSYGRNNTYFYYKCKRCNKTISQNFLLDYIENILVPYRVKQDKIHKLDKERYVLARRIKKLHEKFIDEKISEREFCSMAIPIEDKINELDFKRIGMRLVNKKISFIDLKQNEKGKYLHSIIKYIKVNPSKNTVVEIKFFDE